MSQTALRCGLVLSMLVVTLCASSDAEARRRGYYYRYLDQNAVGDRNQAGGSLPSRGAGFVPTVDQLIRGCSQEAVELKNWPFDYLAQIVGPDEGQRNALQRMQDTAADASDMRPRSSLAEGSKVIAISTEPAPTRRSPMCAR
jgi:hypothetical protein